MDTFDELCVKLLAKADVEDILELLQVTPEELLDRFDFRVAERMEELEAFIDD
jgi:hypothetical protein